MSSNADLFFDGGGVKAIAVAGAYVGLEQSGFVAQRVAGSSGGAIIAALVAVGYSGDEIAQIARSMPFAQFRDRRRKGAYRGDTFLAWIEDLLAARGITRFGDLGRDNDNFGSGDRWRLNLIASDLTHRRLLVLPSDAQHLGVDPDELDVAYAVRMSMSIPGVFEPVVHDDARTGQRHVIVDGGVMSNIPVWLFDTPPSVRPRWPTFGIVVVEPEPRKPIGQRIETSLSDPGIKSGSATDLLPTIAAAMMEAHQRLYVDESTFARTIPVPALGIGTAEFDITAARVEAAFVAGNRAAFEFLAHWDFESYLEFRLGHEHSRREQVSGPRLTPTPPPASEAEDPDAVDVTPDGIFLNYRRSEVQFVVNALHDRIVSTFGEARVFRDVDSIQPGDDWEDSILRAIRRTRVMLVVIGPNWIAGVDSDAGADHPDNWLRREIEEAFEHQLRVIPVLAERGALPNRDELPESLTPLLGKQAIAVTTLDDIDRVIAAVERIDTEA